MNNLKPKLLQKNITIRVMILQLNNMLCNENELEMSNRTDVALGYYPGGQVLVK